GASALIVTYGTVGNLIAHAGEGKHKRYREGLLANAEQARQSKELARIRIDVPVAFDPTAVRYRGASRERCFQIFNELAFHTIVAEYAPTADTINKTYRILTSLEEARELAARLADGKRVAMRVIGDHPAPMRASIIGFALSSAAREADYIPVGHRALGEHV